MGDEELAPASVFAGVRHAQGTGGVFMSVQVCLTLDLVAGPAGAYPRIAGFPGQRVASLNHEVLDDTVEPGTIVELAVGKLLEVADGTRYFGVEQLRFDGAFAGFYSCALRHGRPLGRMVL